MIYFISFYFFLYFLIAIIFLVIFGLMGYSAELEDDCGNPFPSEGGTILCAIFWPFFIIGLCVEVISKALELLFFDPLLWIYRKSKRTKAKRKK